MATQRRKKTNWIKIILVIALIVAAGLICFFVWKVYFSDEKPVHNNGDKDSSAVVDDKTKKEEKKEEKKESDTDKKDEKEKVPQYDGDDPNEKDELTGVITYVGVNNGKLMIRVNIDQYVNGGTCTLGLRREGMNVYSATANIIDAASTATCEGFDVPVSGLGEGPTVITIYLSADGKTGEIGGEVTL